MARIWLTARVNELTVEELVLKLTAELLEFGIESARFEAKELVASACVKKFSFENVDDNELKALNEMVCRRKQNEPLQYILGEWEFYGLPFKVGSGVLIPRQDTETLVETASPLIKSDDTVFDLCAGSGCIGITLSKLSGANVYLFEKSRDALKYIKENGYTTVVMADVIQYVQDGKPLPPKPVMLTFDDGNYNNYVYAYPLMQK